MLQIVTGMYFQPGLPLRRTQHRATLYTNCVFLPAEPIQLEVGRLLPETGFKPIMTLTVEVDEWLEVNQRDGETLGLISTGGQDLIDDLSLVLSFAFDATFSADRYLVMSLVEDGTTPRRRYGTPSGLLTRTFDPGVVIREDDTNRADAFIRTLIDLPRSDFERALRAIKRMVLAIRRAATDPTAAYADVVAALESLADDRFTTPIAWDQYDGEKSKKSTKPWRALNRGRRNASGGPSSRQTSWARGGGSSTRPRPGSGSRTSEQKRRGCPHRCAQAMSPACFRRHTRSARVTPTSSRLYLLRPGSSPGQRRPSWSRSLTGVARASYSPCRGCGGWHTML
jgi:hypothetical protein